MSQQLDVLAKRLDALERRNRRLTCMLIGAVVLAAAAGTRAQVGSATVSGDRFVLVDAQNRTRATLDSAAATPGTTRYPMLAFLDAAGKTRLRLGLGARGPVLEVVDESGKVRDYFAPAAPRPITQP